MPSTDFGSNQKSPGGYGGSSGGQSGGSSGGAGSGRSSSDNRNYTYSSGTQPNGTTSQGNWNTGGKKVATGNPSNLKPIPQKQPTSIADAVSARPPLKKKLVVKRPPRRVFGPLKRWTPGPTEIAIKPIFGAGTPSPVPGEVNYPRDRLPSDSASYDPATGYGLGQYSGKDQSRVSTKDQSRIKDQSRMTVGRGLF